MYMMSSQQGPPRKASSQQRAQACATSRVGVMVLKGGGGKQAQGLGAEDRLLQPAAVGPEREARETRPMAAAWSARAQSRRPNARRSLLVEGEAGFAFDGKAAMRRQASEHLIVAR